MNLHVHVGVQELHQQPTASDECSVQVPQYTHNSLHATYLLHSFLFVGK